jgi:cell division protein FtsQ
VVVIILAVWLVAFSPVLGVRTVSVSGTHRLTVDEVRTAAAVRSGTPLIRLDTGAVRARVAALPDVADVEVSVSYPSTVHITITERTPVGYLTTSTGYVLIDRSGAQYRQSVTQPAGLPRFELPTNADGSTNSTDPEVVASGHAIAVVAAALASTSAPVLAKLSAISANSPDSITLVLRDGRIVTWGSADRSDEKARLLPALLLQPGSRFDVSNPDLVVVR